MVDLHTSQELLKPCTESLSLCETHTITVPLKWDMLVHTITPFHSTAENALLQAFFVCVQYMPAVGYSLFARGFT